MAETEQDDMFEWTRRLLTVAGTEMGPSHIARDTRTMKFKMARLTLFDEYGKSWVLDIGSVYQCERNLEAIYSLAERVEATVTREPLRDVAKVNRKHVRITVDISDM